MAPTCTRILLKSAHPGHDSFHRKGGKYIQSSRNSRPSSVGSEADCVSRARVLRRAKCQSIQKAARGYNLGSAFAHLIQSAPEPANLIGTVLNLIKLHMHFAVFLMKPSCAGQSLSERDTAARWQDSVLCTFLAAYSSAPGPRPMPGLGS